MKTLLSAPVLYRASAVVFVLFAVAHTLGFLTFVPPSPEGRAVLEKMNDVSFAVGDATFSYGGFYRGFGLFVTMHFLICGVIAWRLATLASRGQETAFLGWLLVVSQAIGLALSVKYFSMPPAVMAALLVVLLSGATWRSERSVSGTPKDALAA